MRGVLLLLAVVVLAVLLVQASMEDPGYVLISRAPHEVEISLSLFLLVLLVIVVLIYFGVRLIIRAKCSWKAFIRSRMRPMVRFTNSALG